jgi:dolichyl-diphosphooligosaccharide--protein glycosyltransferase
MSQLRANLDEATEFEDSASIIERYYHVPVLVLLIAFTLWNRVQNWQNFIADGQVYFSGNDPWYHYRTVTYTVRHWPETMPFDPWTYFPYGAHSSQFGTVFDQIIATAALIVGLGDPSPNTIALVLLFAPAIFGTALAIPTYLIGKRLGGRFGGIMAVAIVVFSSGGALARGTVGFSDHQIGEAFFQVTAILAVMVAVTVAQREKPVFELFRDRAFDAVRRPIGWSILAGFAVALYIWSWPPGVFLLGILGLYFTVEIASEFAHGKSPEHVAIAGVVTMATAGVLILAAFESVEVSATGFTVLQPGLAFAGAVWFAFLAWLAREWEARDVSDKLYPVGIAAILLAVAGLMAVVLPDIFGFFVNQTTRVIGFSTSPTAGTVGEAQPLRSVNQLYAQYGLAVVVAAITALVVAARHFMADKPRADLTLAMFWVVFMLAATGTQARFSYYLVAPIAVLNAHVVGAVVRYADLTPDSMDVSNLYEEIELYQVLTVLTVVFVLVVPLFLMQPTALQYGQSAGPGQAVQAWDESLEWMQENTPAEGNFGDANNEIAYYGTFSQTDDYQYPAGTYGVMSWWDYGHWITVEGQRIPNANPFQQGSNTAANFLLAPNETQANEVLEEQADEGDNAKTRYVMVDWKMASVYSNYGGKFFAPPAFYDEGNVSRSDYYSPVYRTNGQQVGLGFYRHKQAYYETMVTRLYRYHGSAMQPEPYVIDWEQKTVQGQTFPGVGSGPDSVPAIFRADNMTAARNYADREGSAQVGGVGPYPTEEVPALQHYRLVQVSNKSAYSSRNYQGVIRQSILGANLPTNASSFAQTLGTRQGPVSWLHQTQPAWVKTFERVDGATIEGTGPANATVTARVTMRVPNSNSTFTYTQYADTGEDGEFSMVVPYSTTGYDEYGPENGRTNVSVRAVSNYSFSTGFRTNESGYMVADTARADVTEGQVIGENDTTVTVDLQRQVLFEPQSSEGTQNGSNGNGTQDGAGENVTDTSDDGSDGSDSTTTTSGDTTTASGDSTPTTTPTDGSTITTASRVELAEGSRVVPHA